MEQFATAQVVSHGGNDNPAVQALMRAMMAQDNLSLSFSKNADVSLQTVGNGMASNGIQLG